ncbi:hypothetical protein SPRG_10367 [Saprolegnia parasitica CBS 223.65]|uniref:Vesicle transport protein n=1 Tax=Saprolegnia parasitica (strain CBS 223.65) TaxID=695850 RepID=A0A067CCK4_SAPPC|nr:hypothetical protein SPRG_10367 [Saprolegnia parasitica CBS 223.65]KDO24552.1 hypothetical protein SPRG_10367 [Saprolegnia parasitica CBS 223.65]|eukprot:XP_012204813.1 hypothetical protein SPRG_10367 [Saprolegnia parasitica CBS 223.65]
MTNLQAPATPTASEASTIGSEPDLEGGEGSDVSPLLTPQAALQSLWGNIKSKSSATMSPAQMDAMKSYPQRFKTFVMLILLSGLFFGMASLFLPLLLIRPSKFALSFSLGSVLALSAIAALRGWKSYCLSLVQPAHLLLTTLYLTSLVSTLYACLIMGSYVYVILSASLQLITLGYFLLSAFPGGVAALNTTGRIVAKSAKGILKGCIKLFQ